MPIRRLPEAYYRGSVFLTRPSQHQRRGRRARTRSDRSIDLSRHLRNRGVKVVRGWRSEGHACAQAALWSHSRRPRRSDMCLLVLRFLWKSGVFVLDGSSWTSKGTWPLFTPLDLQPLSLAEEPPMGRRSHDRRLEAATDRQVSLCPPGDPRTQTALIPSGS